MGDDALDVLRRHLVVRSAFDALTVVGSAGRVLPPGTNLVVHLDDDGRFLDHWPVTDSDDHLEFVIAATCELASPEVRGAFLVSNRSGQVPADRPDDERRWCELGAIAEDAGIDLLDWLVVCGTVAFSVAEHAAIGAGWPTTQDALAAHPELRYDPTRTPAHHRSQRMRGRRHPT